jgi:hypothetical protein
MRRLIATSLLATALTGGATAALAQEPGCDSYSGECVSETATTTISPSVKPRRLSKPSGSLTVTGGEAVLLLAVGGAAVAGGTALVVASRKSKTAS